MEQGRWLPYSCADGRGKGHDALRLRALRHLLVRQMLPLRPRQDQEEVPLAVKPEPEPLFQSAPEPLQEAARLCRRYGMRVSIQALGAFPRSPGEQALRDAIDLLEREGWIVSHDPR